MILKTAAQCKAKKHKGCLLEVRMGERVFCGRSVGHSQVAFVEARST
jgi:hypothetical protein